MNESTGLWLVEVHRNKLAASLSYLLLAYHVFVHSPYREHYQGRNTYKHFVIKVNHCKQIYKRSCLQAKVLVNKRSKFVLIAPINGTIVS